jgi:hypothetical protein
LEIGNTNDVFEKACVLPLKVILLPENVAVPVIVFPKLDLSVHDVTVVVEFIVEASAPSNHNAHPGISTGVNTLENAGKE